jgi:hypothetical protein
MKRMWKETQVCIILTYGAELWVINHRERLLLKTGDDKSEKERTLNKILIENEKYNGTII